MRRIIIASICVVSVLLAACWGRTGEAGELRGNRTVTPPIMAQLRLAFAQEHRDAAEKLRVIAADIWSNSEAFGRGQCDMLLSVGQLSSVEPTIIAQSSPDGNFIKWEKAQVGQMRVIAVVNAANPVERLTFDQIQKLLSDKGLKTTWKDLGSTGGLVTCYGEHEESASRAILQTAVMSYKNREDPDVPGVRYSGYFPFRDNFAQCPDAQEVIDEIARDANGIGLLCYAGKLPKEVKVLELAEKPAGQFVKPRLDSSHQADYPLSQPVLLHLHPGATPEAREFYDWAQRKYLQASQQTDGRNADPASRLTTNNARPDGKTP